MIANSLTDYQMTMAKGAAQAPVIPTVFHVGETLFLVGSYTFNPGVADDTCSLWVNPNASSLGTATPPAATVQDLGVGANDLEYIASFNFRASWNYTIDQLRIGRSWSDVTPVPEPAVAGQVLAVAAAALLFRRAKGPR